MEIKPFLSLIGKHRPANWLIAAAVVLGLGETVLSLFIPLLTKNVVEPTAKEKRAITFEGVGFAYSTDRPILRNLTFSAQPGGMTAIVGPSGTGKTTLFSLI